MRRRAAFILLAIVAGAAQAGDTVTVAVASNFRSTATLIANRFGDETGHAVQLSAGSTGKLYAQIVHGAPFAVFLAADAARPALLEQAGRAVPGSRFTYATGSLVIFSTRVQDCLAALRDPGAGFVALGNPATSPYGAAAQQYLEGAGMWDLVSERAVYGENITQAWQFAVTGNAVIGFAARAQLRAWPHQPSCVYEVPTSAHDPLEQQAVLLDGASEAARAFLEFLRSAEARELVEQDGYEMPE